MIAAVKIGSTVGIAAFLAMCVTTPAVKHHHHSHRHYHKTVHEFYTPTPSPVPTLSPSKISLAPIPQPISTPTPWYRTTAHHNPPWSPNYKPD